MERRASYSGKPTSAQISATWGEDCLSRAPAWNKPSPPVLGDRTALVFPLELLPPRLAGEGVSLSGITKDEGCIISNPSAILLKGHMDW
jgi:hypothetical protein